MVLNFVTMLLKISFDQYFKNLFIVENNFQKVISFSPNCNEKLRDRRKPKLKMLRTKTNIPYQKDGQSISI